MSVLDLSNILPTGSNNQFGKYTVFPRIVSAETILFWKLKCGNYSREETINLSIFYKPLLFEQQSHRFCSFHNSFQSVIKQTATDWNTIHNSYEVLTYLVLTSFGMLIIVNYLKLLVKIENSIQVTPTLCVNVEYPKCVCTLTKIKLRPLFKCGN